MTTRRRAAIAASVALLVAAVGGPAAFWFLSGPAAASPDQMARLRARRDRLLARAEAAFVARHPLEQVERREGNVVLAIRNGFLGELVERLVPPYLGQVELDLRGVEADAEGDLHKGTPLGDLKVGSWSLHLVLHDARGVLHAGKPELTFENGHVRVQQPFDLSDGHVRAGLAFRWDAAGIANLVCRDFERAIDVAGRAQPRHYSASGSFLVSAEDGLITLQPDFGRPRFRLMVQASPQTWRAVRSALERQDRFFQCGVAMDPEQVVDRLRERVARGFEIRLPRKLFHAVRWPAHLSEQLEVQGRRVRLDVKEPEVQMTRPFLVYSARVAVRRGGNAARPE